VPGLTFNKRITQRANRAVNIREDEVTHPLKILGLAGCGLVTSSTATAISTTT
jgi:hypothetical protein